MPSPFKLPRLPLAGEPLPWSSDSFSEFAAAAALCRLDGMAEAFARNDLFRATWALKEAQASNLIESTATTFDEVVVAQTGVVLSRSRRDDVAEVLNCRKAITEGICAVREGTPITLSLIKNLHAVLLDGAGGMGKNPGTFRNIQVHIGRPGSGIENAVYIPPPPQMLQGLLENWLQFLTRTDLNPLVQAAVIYAFKDYLKESGERYGFIEKMKKDPSITQEDFNKKRELFGVIVFESDQDLDPLTAYLCCEDRWQIELVFDAYKNDECRDCTNVQDDFSVFGSEFVNSLATILTCRLRRRAQRAGLLNKCSFKDLMEDLATAWRRVDGPLSPASDDSYWVTDYPGVFDLLERLGLSKPKPNSKAKPEVTSQGIVVHRRPGRPRTRPIIYGPPRPRGRPRKRQ